MALDPSSRVEDTIEPWEATNLPAAYNQSIYLMLAVPYTLLGVFGFLVYRGLKKNEAYKAQLALRQRGDGAVGMDGI